MGRIRPIPKPAFLPKTGNYHELLSYRKAEGADEQLKDQRL